MKTDDKQIITNGLWHNNPALVQILGLCPLLAVSNNVVNALGLGLATIFVLLLSNVLVSVTRRWLRPEIRIPVFVLLIASGVTIVEIIIQAFAYTLYQALGIYLTLIVTNCAIIARAEAFAIKNPLRASALDGISMGVGFTAVLILLGGMRELLASGSLFMGADRLFGEAAANWGWQIWSPDHGVILAALPAGAFIAYGLIIALKNVIDQRFHHAKQTVSNTYTQSPEAASLAQPDV